MRFLDVKAAAFACVFAAVSSLGAAAEVKLADVDLTSGTLAVRPLVDTDGVSVSVSGPDGYVLTRAFGRGEAPVLTLAGAEGGSLPDGAYNYEVSLNQRPLARAGEREAQDAGLVPRRESPARVVRGAFRVLGGVLYYGERREAEAPRRVAAPGASSADAPGPGPEPDDQVIPDDLIVQGSICAGFDCVNNESFGFDTIRLKENNLRIGFMDTSVGTFPTNDWELTANDSASGGADRFSITDITGSKTPFTVTAGAPTSSFHMDSTGRVGLRTSTPVLDLHIKTSNTPAMRLEQDGSGGFTAQTWDIAGNEANFFVRDVTSGSRLPFRIRPGAPTSSIDINASGLVGFGTASPTKALHVSRTDGNAQVLVSETSGTTAIRTLMALTNNGAVRSTWANTATGTTWAFDNGNSAGTSSDFSINNIGNAGVEFAISPTGAVTALSFTPTSDRNAKRDIVEVDERAVLDKVAALPISTWRFKQTDELHMGPMAQDFAASFGLGTDDKHINLTDISGVALAAIKALNNVVAEKDAKLLALEKQNAELAARLAAIEQALAAK